MKHNVELDSAGWGGRVRLTCYTCNKTLVKQPYMNTQQWYDKIRQFANDHPSQIVTAYLNKLRIKYTTFNKNIGIDGD